jgi:hypothetical protein
MTDPQPLSGADRLDEDELGLDPLEAGMDPPERWSEADRSGMTEAEQRRGAPLDERLAEEEPDISAERWDAMDELDSRQASSTANGEPIMDDRPEEMLSESARRGQSADRAGGSVAEQIRTPREPD